MGSTSWKKRTRVPVLARLLCVSLLSSLGGAHTGHGKQDGCKNPYTNLPCDVFDRTMTPSVLMHFQHPPTIAPTVSPTPVPTLAPTDKPTPEPTAEPTSSAVPTVEPTDAPSETVQPTRLDERESGRGSGTCRAVDGVFGEITGDLVLLDYRYEVELNPTITANLEMDVLPPLEAAFIDFVLRDLFPGECSRRRLMNSRRLEFLGISARPKDTVSTDLFCDMTVEAGNICSVVNGELTLFSDGNRRLTEERDILDSLHRGMSESSFDDVHPSIVRVSFVDILPGARGGVETGNEDNGDSDSDDRPLRVGLLVGAAAAILLGLVVIARTAKTPQWAASVDRNEEAEQA